MCVAYAVKDQSLKAMGSEGVCLMSLGSSLFSFWYIFYLLFFFFLSLNHFVNVAFSTIWDILVDLSVTSSLE